MTEELGAGIVNEIVGSVRGGFLANRYDRVRVSRWSCSPQQHDKTRDGCTTHMTHQAERTCLIMDLAVRRSESTSAAWERTVSLLPGVDGRGRPWWDHRQVINGVLWRLRTGAPWRDLSERCGPWQTL